MTIDEAIKELEIWLVSPAFRHSPHGHKAIKLSIEALKKIKALRIVDWWRDSLILPGEEEAHSSTG